jgi:hypothetical protein
MAFLKQQLWRNNTNSVDPIKIDKNLKNSIKLMRKEQEKNFQNSSEDILDNLKLLLNIIKMYLQLSVTCSQNGNHEKAINCGKKCLRFFSLLMNSLSKILNLNNNNLEVKICEFVDVVNKDNNLKEKFNSFLDFVKKLSFYLQNALISFEQKNNEFFSKDPFFGNMIFEGLLKKTNLVPPWLKKMNISNFMHVEFVYWEKLNEKVKFNDIFSEAFLSSLVMLVSTIFFMISTENRLYCIFETNLVENEKSKIKTIFERNFISELKKNKRFIFSRKLHELSITLLENYFEENDLTNHIINSFSLNYESVRSLEKIVS